MESLAIRPEKQIKKNNIIDKRENLVEHWINWILMKSQFCWCFIADHEWVKVPFRKRISDKNAVEIWYFPCSIFFFLLLLDSIINYFLCFPTHIKRNYTESLNAKGTRKWDTIFSLLFCHRPEKEWWKFYFITI